MKKYVCVILFLSVLLSACGRSRETENQQPLADAVLAEVPFGESTPRQAGVKTYVVPANIPHIHTDLFGYEPEDEKYAVLQGEALSEEFVLLRAEDGAEVYRAALRLRSGAEGIYRADLSSINTPGEYLLFQEDVGYSYPFSIREGIYSGWIDGYLEALNQTKLSDPLMGAAILMNLMQVAEFDAADFSELPLKLGSAAQWLMELMDASGAVAAPDSQAATLLCAVALGRMSAMLAAVDKTFSAECLAAAELSYTWLAGRRMSIADPAWYMLNAELMRDSGKEIYRNELRSLFKSGTPREAGDNIGEVDPVYWGDVAYLSCTKGADRSICDGIMAEYMSRARQISEAVKSDPYLSSEHEDMRALLKDARLLAWVNGVITNREYRDTMKEELHYLCGRNPQAVSYVTKRGVLCDGEENELYYGSLLAVVLSRIDLRYIQVE